LGTPKALVRLHGQLLVERALGVLRAGGCSPLVVVLGAQASDVRAGADLGDTTVVVNDEWATGMGSSLRVGLAALSGAASAAALVSLVDTPGVGAAAARRLSGLASADMLAVATYGGKRGHPVLLGRAHWAGVSELATGDAGARDYLAAHRSVVQQVPCDDIADPADIDTAEDLDTAQRRATE